MRYATIDSGTCSDFAELYNRTTQLNLTFQQRIELENEYTRNYNNNCVKKYFFCVNQKHQKTTGPWEKETFSTAKKKCEKLDSQIQTPYSGLNLTNNYHFWTGSKRWNRFCTVKKFENNLLFLRTHFKREDGHLFDPKKSPEQTRLEFSEAVHLQSRLIGLYRVTFF